MGRASYDRIWRPLFEGKFGAATEEVGLPWFWARVHDRTSALGYSRGGFRPFYEGLAERVRANGGSVRLNTVVQSVERTATGYIVHARGAGGDERASHDEVISTLPPRLTADLAPDLPAS
jgi:protoporphyrinogen oxidase